MGRCFGKLAYSEERTHGSKIKDGEIDRKH